MPTPNSIKYSTTVQPFSIKKGNVVIAVENGFQYGPTDNGVVIPAIDVTATRTFWWNGITPPSAGYSIYNVFNGNSAVGGQPQIVCSTTSEDLIYQAKRFGGTNIVTSGDVLSYFASGTTDVVCVNKNYPSIITSGLTLLLDAGFTPSYPTVRNTWYDLSGNGYHGTLVNGVSFSTVSGGTMVFDGTNQYISFSTYTQPAQTSATSFTWNVWLFSNTATSSPILGNRFGGASWTKYTGFGFEYNSVQNVLTGGTTNGVWRNMSIHKNNTSFSLYRDGSLISTGTNTGSTSSLPFYIGGDPGGEFSNGFVSIVQIYNRSLSSTEVLQNYNAQRSRFNI